MFGFSHSFKYQPIPIFTGDIVSGF